MKKPTKKTAATKPVIVATTSTSTMPAPKAVAAAKPAVVPAAAVTAAPAKPVAPVVTAGPVKSAAPTKTPIVTAAAPITIEAKIDVGFGNNLFLRGQGEGLSWDRGIPLENVDSKTWRLTVPAKDKVQFKLLINDAVWAKGEDLVAVPGKKVEITPAF
jgi:hypothetical protein